MSARLKRADCSGAGIRRRGRGRGFSFEDAEGLGNTPAVARSSYVDPKLLDCFRDGATIALPRSAAGATLGPRQRARIEREVLALLD